MQRIITNCIFLIIFILFIFSQNVFPNSYRVVDDKRNYAHFELLLQGALQLLSHSRKNLVLFYDFGTNSTHLCHAKSLRLDKFQPNKI